MIAASTIKPALATLSTVLPAGLSLSASAPLPEGFKGEQRSPLTSGLNCKRSAQFSIAGQHTDAANIHHHQSTDGATELPPGERA